MNFGQSLSSVFSQYLGFSGRACRSEYWWFALFEIIVTVVLSIINPILYVIFIVAVIMPGLAVAVRRLHDTGRSAWWLLLGIVPFGSIVLLIFTVLPGNPGENRYGPNPLRPEEGLGYADFQGIQDSPARSGYCTNCGAELEPVARFCRLCGTAASE